MLLEVSVKSIRDLLFHVIVLSLLTLLLLEFLPKNASLSFFSNIFDDSRLSSKSSNTILITSAPEGGGGPK
jgi:hypothetical protein